MKLCVISGFRREIAENCPFWISTQRVVQFLSDVSEQPIGPILRVQES